MASSMLRLRAGGCRQFASSAVGLMVASDKMYSLGEKKILNINIEKEFERRDWVVGSSHGWVGLLKKEEEFGSSSGVSLWNPMSGSRVKLPPLHTKPHNDTPYFTSWIRKLIVDDAECSRAIMNMISISESESWLGVCCPGGCSEWTMIGQYCRDVVACGSQSRRVYSLGCEELVEWDISDPRKPRIEWSKDLVELGYGHTYGDMMHHLVYAKHSDQLFLVKRHLVDPMDPHGASVREDDWNFDTYPHITVEFDVYLVDKDKGKARCIKHSNSLLDGLVMFLGLNNSFAVAAADFPHLNPGSIYFTDHVDCLLPRCWEVVYEGHDIGIYDYKNRTVSSCYYPSRYQALKRIDPYPFWFAQEF